MINTVASTTPLDDPRDDRRPKKQLSEGDVSTVSAASKLAPQPDVRLVIEEDKARGVLIYKLIDRVTGEIVSEVSRDDLMKMGEDPAYRAGKVISTKA